MPKERLERFKQRLVKFRYPALILAIGLLLLLIPGKNAGSDNSTNTEEILQAKEDAEALYIEEERLGQLLSQMQGAGEVRVMLSLKAGAEIIFQTDCAEQGTGAGDFQQEFSTVLYKSNSNQQSALVRQKTAPVYQGAIILCQGAENPSIKLALVQAVSGLTGLGADCITVIKMK